MSARAWRWLPVHLAISLCLWALLLGCAPASAHDYRHDPEWCPEPENRSMVFDTSAFSPERDCCFGAWERECEEYEPPNCGWRLSTDPTEPPRYWCKPPTNTVEAALVEDFRITAKCSWDAETGTVTLKSEGETCCTINTGPTPEYPIQDLTVCWEKLGEPRPDWCPEECLWMGVGGCGCPN